MINRFVGEYFYLSNFFEAPVMYEGILYRNNEAAFQAQKVLDLNERKSFSSLSPVEAKNKGRVAKLRPDWENIKEVKMYEICKAKFEQNPELYEKLMFTGNRPLEEGNTWGDREWGTVDGVGNNKLGKILMRIRKEGKDLYLDKERGKSMEKSRLEELVEEMGVVMADEAEMPQEEAEEVMVYDEK